MDQPDLTALAEGILALRASVDGLRDEIMGLQAYGRRSRRLLWRGWAVGAVVVVLIAGQIFTSQRVQRNSTAVQRINDRAIVNCETSNTARGLNRELWGYVLSFPDVRQLSPQEKAQRDYQIAQFKAYIARAFADQDCSKVNQPVTGTVRG